MPKANPLFSKIQVKEPPRSMFDLSHENKLSCNMGELIPALVVETLPGDKFKIQADIFTRLKPMVAPMMHRVDVTMHYFFVPNRLVWDNPTDHDDSWESFITGGKDGTLTPTKPYFTCSLNDSDYEESYYNVCQLPDYMGINIQNRFLDADRQGTKINICYDAMPFRAYRKIFDDYYMDENLGAPLPESSGLSILQGGEIAAGNSDYEFEVLHQIMSRYWEKDYFTSALPWVQRGDPMAIPFTASGTNVILDDSVGASHYPKFKTVDGDVIGDWSSTGYNMSFINAGFDESFLVAGTTDGAAAADTITSTSNMWFDPNGSLKVSELTNVATIQDLRIASKIQRWMEAHGLSGARYNETILTDFFTKVPDYRLQRAEYLGGGVVPVMINEVLQTSESSTTPLGEMAGHGVSSGGDNGCYYYCQEHGFIFGILSILPKAAYMQGLSKMWTRFDRFDYAFPRLQGIGEQPVYRREVLFRGDNNGNLGYGDNEIFGYQSQNADYKFMMDEVHGDFKTTLSYWHMARKFSYESKATLNTGFVQFSEDQICNPFSTDLNNGDNHFLCDIWFNMQSSRYLPFWATPSLN